VIERSFVPEDHSFKQTMLPGMPKLDYEHIRELDRLKRRRTRTAGPVAEAGTLWRSEDRAEEQPEELQAPGDGEEIDRASWRCLPAISLIPPSSGGLWRWATTSMNCYGKDALRRNSAAIIVAHNV